MLMYWFRHHRRSLMRLTLTARGALLRREFRKSVRGAGLCRPGNEPGFRPAAAAAVPPTDARGWYGDDQQLIAELAFRNSTSQGAYLIVAARLLGLRKFRKP
jgi:hypothetical protein